MLYKREKTILENYILEKGMKFTQQRLSILEVFLSIETHITAEELYKKVVHEYPEIGLATVYRTLNILSKCGLAQKRQFGDGYTRFEHILDHKHHDHLICLGCGSILEFENEEIEKLQDNIIKNNEFLVYYHKLEIYGYCKECKRIKHSKKD